MKKKKYVLSLISPNTVDNFLTSINILKEAKEF